MSLPAAATPPLLTVAVTAYNYGRFLPVCLDSILGQDFTDLEVLVLDNCSSDDTQQVMRAYADDPRVRYIRHAINMSSVYNWNLAVRSGVGRYFALISADDFILPGHFSKLIGLLQANPRCVMAYTPIQHVDVNCNAVNAAPHPGYSKTAYAGGRDDHAGLLAYGNYTSFTASIFDRAQIGDDLYFDMDGLGAGDLEFDIRLARKYRHFAFDPVASVCYRQHIAQHTTTTFYKTAEPLYGHMFFLERDFDCLTVAQIAQYRTQFAAQIEQFVPAFDQWKLHADERARVRRLLNRLQPDYDALQEAPVDGRVSVLLPYAVFEQYAGHSECDDAIFTMLEAQSYVDWECIVSYDGSAVQLQRLTGVLQSLSSPWKIQLLPSDAINLAESLNAAAVQASGAYLLVLDRVTPLPADRLQQAVALLQQQTSADIAAFVHPSEIAFFDHCKPESLVASTHNPVADCAVFRRQVWLAASRFNPVFNGHDILWDFWIHASKRGAHIAVLPDEQALRAMDDPSAAPLTAAVLAFANLGCVTVERLSEVIEYLIKQLPAWRAANQTLLDRCRGYTTAIALDYLVKSAEVVRPAPTPSLPPAPTGEQYVRWILDRRLTAAQGSRFMDMVRQWPKPPRLAPVVLDLHNDRPLLLRSLRSIQAQVFAAEKIIVLSTGSQHGVPADPRLQWLVLEEAWADTLNRLLPQTGADWFYLLHAGDSLEPDALLLLADTVHHYPDLACAYSDEDTMDVNGSVADPVFKPSLNLDLLRAMPYTGRTMAVSRDAFIALGGFASSLGDIAPIDLLFRAIENRGFGAVAHLNQVLCHTGLSFAEWRLRDEVLVAQQQAGAAHLSRLGVAADLAPQADGVLQVTYRHAAPLPVSIVMQAQGALGDLQRSVQNILKKTAYTAFELLIVAADPSCREAARINLWLQQIAATDGRIGLLPAAGPGQAAALNLAVQQAGGEYLLFLGHATVVLQTEWLDLLMNHAQRQEVGVVGGKLIDSQKRIKHAGAVAGLNGPAGAVFVNEAMDGTGYHARLQASQNYSIVSGDCMLVRGTLFRSLGGFDEQYRQFDLAAADLCLRSRDAGYLTVWTPHAVLLHEDNAIVSGLQRIDLASQTNAFYRRWWPLIAGDPAYNANLAMHGNGFEVEGRIALFGNAVMALKRPKILVLTDAAGAQQPGLTAALAPYLALHETGLVEVVVLAQLPGLSDLARMAPDSIVVLGALDQACMQQLQQLHDATPLRLIHAPLAPPTADETALLHAMTYRISLDRVIVADTVLAAAYQAFHAEVKAVGAYAPVIDARASFAPRRTPPVSGRPPQLRVALDGDTDAAGLALIADIFAQLAASKDLNGSVSLVVWARSYPLALASYIAEYHQQSPFAPAAFALSALEPFDLALLPDAEASSARLLQIMAFGSAGIPVIGMTAGVDDLPLHNVGVEVAQWLDAIRGYIAKPALLAKHGEILQHAVREKNALNSERLASLRDALI
jgi:GT2 family glycosyltransferase